MSDYSDLILLMGAMVLFSLVSHNYNRNSLNNLVIDLESEKDFSSVAVLGSVLGDVKYLAFDENVQVIDEVATEKDFVLAKDLGRDAGESDRADFDDVDDYNNHKWTTTTDNGTYTVWTTVCYVSDAKSTNCTNSRTRFKLMKLYVQFDNLNPTQYGIERAPNYLTFLKTYYN